jgi:hypothetical protein
VGQSRINGSHTAPPTRIRNEQDAGAALAVDYQSLRQRAGFFRFPHRLAKSPCCVESFRVNVAAQSLHIFSNVIASDQRAEAHARVHEIGNASNFA